MSDRTYRATAGTLYRAMRDEGVLMQLETGQYFGLDPIAHRMWQLLIELGDRDSILAQMESEYDTAPAVLAADFDGLIQEWLDERLIERAASGAGADRA